MSWDLFQPRRQGFCPADCPEDWKACLTDSWRAWHPCRRRPPRSEVPEFRLSRELIRLAPGIQWWLLSQRCWAAGKTLRLRPGWPISPRRSQCENPDHRTATPAEILAVGPEPDYIYEPELAESPRIARYIEGTEIEVIGELPMDLQIEHCIFDHDGTLSTLREGWEKNHGADDGRRRSWALDMRPQMRPCLPGSRRKFAASSTAQPGFRLCTDEAVGRVGATGRFRRPQPDPG